MPAWDEVPQVFYKNGSGLSSGRRANPEDEEESSSDKGGANLKEKVQKMLEARRSDSSGPTDAARVQAAEALAKEVLAKKTIETGIAVGCLPRSVDRRGGER